LFHRLLSAAFGFFTGDASVAVIRTFPRLALAYLAFVPELVAKLALNHEAVRVVVYLLSDDFVVKGLAGTVPVVVLGDVLSSKQDRVTTNTNARVRAAQAGVRHLFPPLRIGFSVYLSRYGGRVDGLAAEILSFVFVCSHFGFVYEHRVCSFSPLEIFLDELCDC
jgi:hypothetical protein